MRPSIHEGGNPPEYASLALQMIKNGYSTANASASMAPSAWPAVTDCSGWHPAELGLDKDKATV
jgi:hypothetical protein